MRKKEIEKRLNIAISNSVPDVLDNILIKCEEKKGFEESMEVVKKENKEKKRFPTKLVGALAMAMICICGLFGFNQYNENNAIDSIVEFDVNPSIELQVNKKEKIIEAIALNEEGSKVLNDMDLKNTDLNVAVNAIVGSMLKNGYISNDTNSILVSVKNDDIEKGNKLQEELSKEIDSLLKVSSVNGSILTQMYDDNDENKKLATENNISEGKARLISKVLDAELKDYNNKPFTFETLSKMSINELNLLLTEKETKVEDVKTTGTASESSYIGREKAKTIAYNHANVSSSKVTKVYVELDYDDGKVVYEVDFSVGNNEYEYEINAKTGNVIEFDKDIEDDEDDRKTTTNSSNNTTSSNKTNVSTNNNTSSSNNKTTTSTGSSYIGKEKAKQIAFSNANVSSSEASRVEVELDSDDRKYEVKFSVGNIEYEYEINAKTGSIIDYDKDVDDDRDD